MRQGMLLAATAALLLTGCPLAVDDPYEIRKPDAATATGGSGSGGAGTATNSASGALGCSHGLENGNETNKDCGGNGCPHCADGLACNRNSDCQSDSCPSAICTPQ